MSQGHPLRTGARLLSVHAVAPILCTASVWARPSFGRGLKSKEAEDLSPPPRQTGTSFARLTTNTSPFTTQPLEIGHEQQTLCGIILCCVHVRTTPCLVVELIVVSAVERRKVVGRVTRLEKFRLESCGTLRTQPRQLRAEGRSCHFYRLNVQTLVLPAGRLHGRWCSDCGLPHPRRLDCRLLGKGQWFGCSAQVLLL
jgi:hypothetical protein